MRRLAAWLTMWKLWLSDATVHILTYMALSTGLDACLPSNAGPLVAQTLAVLDVIDQRQR